MRRPVLAVTAILIFLATIYPLILPLAMGGVFGALFYPWQEKLVSKRISPYLASTIVTGGVTLGILLPLCFLIFLGAKVGLEQLGSLDILKDVSSQQGAGNMFDNIVRSVLEKPSIRRLFDSVGSYFPIEIKDIAQTAHSVARAAATRLATALANVVTQLPTTLVSISVTVVSIFFFLADGVRLGIFVRRHSFLSSRQTDRVIQAFVNMSRSVILAAFASGVVQAAIVLIACVIAGRSNAFLIGLLVLFTSFIPLIGAAPVTVLVGIHELLTVGTMSGVGLLIVAAVVGMVDNFIRPMVLKGSADLHPLIAFVAAFGGLQVMGVAGVFLGPVIAGVFIVVLDVLAANEDHLPPARPPMR